jgi:hypothetical protein
MHYADFAEQAVRVRRHLENIEDAEVAAAAPPATPPGTAPTRRLAEETGRAFADAADRHRSECCRRRN